MKCPVCDNVNTSLVCLRCGFDGSTDYERYPTFGAVGKVPTVSALGEQWRENPTPPEPEKQPRKGRIWLVAAACALAMGLGIWIGTGMGKAEPAEPIESIQMQEPVETTDPVETVAPAVTEPKPTEPKPTEPKPTEPKELTLTYKDVTCEKQSEIFTIYVKFGGKDINRSKITWSTSDPAVATVDNGTVTPVGKGECIITAEYDGQKATCVVRCRFENETKPAVSDWRVRPSDDVGIVVGETFRLRVTNSAGEEADVIWTMNKEGIISIEGNKVTGRAPGTVRLKTEIDGITLTCIVRVE